MTGTEGGTVVVAAGDGSADGAGLGSTAAGVSAGTAGVISGASTGVVSTVAVGESIVRGAGSCANAIGAAARDPDSTAAATRYLIAALPWLVLQAAEEDLRVGTID